MSTAAIEIALEPADNERLANLCGQFDENLRLLERRTGVEIGNRGNQFKLVGEHDVLVVTERVIRQLYSLTGTRSITGADVHLELRNADMSGEEEFDDSLGSIRTRRTMVKARGVNQRKYLDAIREFDISFGIGPAGTGKTYLAVASAVAALDSDSVRRICLVRPAVEAGERLGFLPGDMSQKIDPYLRPLYDALYEMLGFERVAKLIERNIIEVAPLAFMRGRTLNESFIILDEAQNTTIEQMKMFLTRIGFGSKAVVTGDVTQIDLPRGRTSGLKHVIEVLDGVEGISFTHFRSKDVVRHTLVARILDAYAIHEADNELERDDERRNG
ncbi:MAG: PhoH family protein [Gammaproteobacteria bacterium]|nr:PhoH family protein [Gammaproteobacteria bacterium]